MNRDPSTNSYWFPPGGTIGLFLNLTKAPYNNVDFRQGVSQALNRTTIAQKAVNGYMAQASLSGLILPNLQQWLNPSLPDQGIVSQNHTAAMTDFTKAGYTLQGRQADRPERHAGHHEHRAAEQLHRLGRGRHRDQQRARRRSASR